MSLSLAVRARIRSSARFEILAEAVAVGGMDAFGQVN
jgi:hypothetical protein